MHPFIKNVYNDVEKVKTVKINKMTKWKMREKRLPVMRPEPVTRRGMSMSKEEGKDQESTQLSTTPGQRHHMGK